MEEKIIGPVLTDGEFFALLDDKNPALKEIVAIATEGRLDEAVHRFAEFIRADLKVDVYFSMSPRPQLTDAMLKTAERALRHEMVSCGTPHKFEGEVDWYANPTFNGYKEWTWQLSRHSEIGALATVYRLTGDEKYADGATELLTSWLRQATRPEDGATRGDTFAWRTIECGIRMLGCWPNIIHSLIHSPAFTDRVIVDVFKSLYEHGHRLSTCLSFGNWLIMELSGLLNVGVDYPYFKESAQWRETALNRFLEEMKTQIHPDGFQYELTTNYHDVVLVNMSVVMRLTEAYGYGIKQELYDTMHRMLLVYVKLMQSGGVSPDINDGSKRTAAYFIGRYIRFFPNDEVLKFIVTDGKDGTPPDYTTSILKNAGHVSFRESWEKNCVTAFFDGGKPGKAHIHEDKLNLLIYAEGKPIISECGCYAYDSSEMRRYSCSSFAHNVCILNGQGQTGSRRFPWDESTLYSEEPVELTLGEKVDRASAFYNGGWGAEPDDTLHRRTVLFVKKPHDGLPFFIVSDEVEGKRSAREFLWHLETSGFNMGNSGVDFKEARILVAKDFDYLGMDYGTEEPFRGWSTKTGQQLDMYPIPTLKVSVEGENTHTVTLIAPKRDGDTPIVAVSEKNGTVTVSYRDGVCEEFKL